MVSSQSSDKLPPGEGQPTPPSIGWGSDAIVEQLSRLNIPYITIVPGASFRGLHDSIVNLKNNTSPQILLCLHEEHAVAIAHGFAKATERQIAVGLHANVGLMHATMAIYNAFCDRVPMLLLGATGPLDAAVRRPWIDWIHTAADQAALIRPFIKFDDQPMSVNAAVRSIVRATATAATKPCAPVYVCLDVPIQEQSIDPAAILYPDTTRYLQTRPAGADWNDVRQVAIALASSKRPLFLIGRVNRSQESWNERLRLVERSDGRVLTDIKQASAFPTPHPLQPSSPSLFLSNEAASLVRESDLIISLDWIDLAGTLQASYSRGVEPWAKIVNISVDTNLHNGWSKDHFDVPPADISIMADPDRFISALLIDLQSSSLLSQHQSGWSVVAPVPATQSLDANAAFLSNGATSDDDVIQMKDLAWALHAAVDPADACYIRVPLSWRGEDLSLSHPLAFLGMDGGAGLGSGPGQAVGSALGLADAATSINDSSLVPIAVLGDGDFLMGSSALWTAAKHRVPLLMVVANNASYYNDEVHQERVARMRGRPVENKTIGISLDDPVPDLCSIAEGYGVKTITSKQLKSRGELTDVLKLAVVEVRAGETVFVDVRVTPSAYSSTIKQ